MHNLTHGGKALFSLDNPYRYLLQKWYGNPL
jgi:hypothetical protein